MLLDYFLRSNSKSNINSGVTYLSQALFGVKLRFMEAGGAPRKIKVDSATELMGLFPSNIIRVKE